MTDDLNEVGGHCPTCGVEYRPGFTVCADDGTPLVPGPAPRPNLPDVDPGGERPLPGEDVEALEDPVALGSWPHEDAWIVTGRLRSEGIAADVDPPGRHSPYGVALSRLFHVMVSRRDLAEARKIIEEYEEA